MESLAGALERLYGRRRMGIKLGLENIQALLAELDHPETTFAAVHVAGTNGKGSVCAMVESALRAAGYRVGMYTSPHLVHYNERVRIEGHPLSDRNLRRALAEVEAAADRCVAAGREAPTFFECSTALAFHQFRKAGVKLAVVETGMGGRLDATNVVMPLVSVITPVTLEHTQHLGPDIATIAREKAGIIKTGRPVVCGDMLDEALDVIRKTAAERRAPFALAADQVTVQVTRVDLSGQTVQVETAGGDYGTVHLPLLGPHQARNLATAVLAVDTLRDTANLEIEPDAVKRGIAAMRWDGRCQVLSRDPVVILDCAHNPGGAASLCESLDTVARGKPIALVVGMSHDKDVAAFLSALSSHVRRAWAVPIPLAERCMDPGHIVETGRLLGIDITEATLPMAWDAGKAWAKESGGVLCLAGSLFLAGEVLARHGGDQEGDGGGTTKRD